ncbi:MAG TPA: dephospho-CoA kinase [Anaerolineales bacterium]|nr:dephospho-CoA kinase [Anaerolineales bacterium]
MTAAKKKTIIGLTGNIATGKTVVRKMLGHLGAYTIDADALTHRIMAQDGPGYEPIIDQFGKFILDSNGDIDRSKLGGLVFSDPEALASLEAIIHPYVRKAVDYMVEKSTQDVVVVEAIKLLESPLRGKMDLIWVTTASEDEQLVRLASKRGMSAAEARKRMSNQSPQAEKAAAADVVIENNGSFEDTWVQVQAGWQKMFPSGSTGDTVRIPVEQVREAAAQQTDFSTAALETDRAKPRQAEDIALLINRLSGGDKQLNRMDIMAAFGEKAFMLLIAEGQLVGVAGWQVENLVARVDEIWLEPALNQAKAVEVLMDSVVAASKELQAEALLVFVDPEELADAAVWQPLNYQIMTIPQLEVTAWKEAAGESQPPDTVILFKQLRIDRVLRPL